MYKTAGSRSEQYTDNKATKDFMEELSRSAGIPVDLLLATTSTGKNEERGAWIHPEVAVNLGQWCSPKIAAVVLRWVREWMTTGQTPIIAAPDLRDRSTILKLLQNRQVSSLAGLNQRNQIHEKAL